MYRFKHDFEVEPNRLIFDVPSIQLEFFFPANRVTTIDLRVTRHARSYIMAFGLFRAVKWQVFHQQWAWANNTHITFNHVPEFWHFIQTGRTQHLTKGR